MPDAIDFSNWTAIPTPIQLDCLRAKGVRKAIIGTRGNPHSKFQAQARACLTAGFSVETYIYLYFAEDPIIQANDAIAKMQGIPVKRVWMDVEGTPQGATKTINSLRAVETRLRQAGYQVGVYTSLSKWPAHTGNTTAFSHLPLWDAHWRFPSGSSAGIDLPPLAFIPYGGWKSCDIVQYVGDVIYCGLNLDLNIIFKDSVVEQEQDMKPFLCWSGRVIFVGPSGPRWITNANVVRELGRVFGGLDANGFPLISLSGEAIMALGGVPA